VVILQWIAATLAAFLAFLFISILFVMTWSHFGGNATAAYGGSILFGTVFGVWAGTATAPNRHWKVALPLFAGVIVLMMVCIALWSLLQGTFSAPNILDVADSILGSVLAYSLIKRRHSLRSVGVSAT
jgi:hypothetical protein